MPTLYEPPKISEICTMATQILGQPVRWTTVYAVKRLLKGLKHGDGRIGPVGVAYTILSKPTGTTAAVMRAQEKLGGIVAYPPQDPRFDEEAWFMAHIIVHWLPLPKAQTATLRHHLSELLIIDPSGRTLPDQQWYVPQSNTSVASTPA